MRILVGTPCALGMTTVQYFLSMLDTNNASIAHKQQMARELMANVPGGFNPQSPEHQMGLAQALHQHTMDVAVYTMSGEALIPRARNHCAQVALTQNYDKLFFIDADTGWTFEQFKAIAMSPHPVIGGVVPLKTYPNFPNNFQTSLNYLPFLEDEKYFTRSLRTLEGTIKMASGHGSEIVKVPFTGTAFLCIDRKVLLKLAETAPEYLYPNPGTGQVETHWSFFDGGPIDAVYYSEDWAFCNKVRALGYDIHIHTGVRLSHSGGHTFVAG